MKTDRPPVLVLGGAITALGVIRSLGRRGIPAFVLGAHEPCVEWSRWYRRYPGPTDLRPSAEGLDRLLQDRREPTLVLMPAEDPWVQALASHGPDPAGHFVSSTPPAEAIASLVDKARLAQALDRYGVEHPRTFAATSAEEAVAAAAGLGDAFLKPRDSFAFRSRFGVKAFRVAGPDEALARARAVFAAGLEFVVQEYVPGPATGHHFVDGFVDREGTVRALFARQRLRMYPVDFGDSSALVSIELDRVASAIEPLKRLLAGLRYRGVFSAEFKLDPRDGVFRLIEINPRPWLFVEFAERAGVNVCEMAYRDALGLPVATTTTYRVGLRCVHPQQDRQAGRELVRRGEISRAALWRSRTGAHEPVLSGDDPVPWVAYVLGRAAGWLGRKVQGVLAHSTRSA